MPPRLRLWILILAGIPLLSLAVAILVGSNLPAEHVATSRARFPVGPDSLWAVITDFPRVPTWRPDVKRMERLPDQGGHPVWLEVGSTGSLPFEITEWDPPRRITTRIADPNLPFGGTWTYGIEADSQGSVLTIVERGKIRNPVFRCLARFLFGYSSTMDGYLGSLGGRFSREVSPEHVTPPP